MQLNPRELDKMSVKQLNALEAELATMKIRKQDEERTALKAKIERLCRDAGFTVAEVLGKGRKNGATKKVAVKFANPENKAETWTGRGRMPRWLAAKVKSGAKVDQFALH
jgi:DNA-binding protein H-NS